jgi:hypothetical protein
MDSDTEITFEDIEDESDQLEYTVDSHSHEHETNISYLKEFWTRMIRPFVDIRTRMRITQTSKFHRTLDRIPVFIRDLYLYYGPKIVSPLFEMLERWKVKHALISSTVINGALSIMWFFHGDQPGRYITVCYEHTINRPPRSVYYRDLNYDPIDYTSICVSWKIIDRYTKFICDTTGHELDVIGKILAGDKSAAVSTALEHFPFHDSAANIPTGWTREMKARRGSGDQ